LPKLPRFEAATRDRELEKLPGNHFGSRRPDHPITQSPDHPMIWLFLAGFGFTTLNFGCIPQKKSGILLATLLACVIFCDSP
jgi:hypothetical protein